MPADPELSIVIPLCNEEATLEPLMEKLAATLTADGMGTFEVIIRIPFLLTSPLEEIINFNSRSRTYSALLTALTAEHS